MSRALDLHPGNDDGPDSASVASDLPAGYGELLQQLKDRVRTTQVRAARAANTELPRLYWSIGRDILDRQEHASWGAKIIDRLATDLRAAFPRQRGWSRRNLQYMRVMAAAWPGQDFMQQPVARLPWGHITVLLGRLDDQGLRDWYATTVIEQAGPATPWSTTSPPTCTGAWARHPPICRLAATAGL